MSIFKNKRVPMTMVGNWNQFSSLIWAGFTPSKVQEVETRRAFYAGMVALQSVMNNLPDNETQAMAVLRGLEEETLLYIFEIAKEIKSRAKEQKE